MIREFFQFVPEFVWRVFKRLDFLCGGILALVYLLLADALGLGESKAVVSTIVLGLAFFEAAYGVFREERDMRAKLEGQVRLVAYQVGGLLRLTEDSKQIARYSAKLRWEIWADVEVSTATLGLDLLERINPPWWRFWNFDDDLVPVTGVPLSTEETKEFEERGGYTEQRGHYRYQRTVKPASSPLEEEGELGLATRLGDNSRAERAEPSCGG